MGYSRVKRWCGPSRSASLCAAGTDAVVGEVVRSEALRCARQPKTAEVVTDSLFGHHTPPGDQKMPVTRQNAFKAGKSEVDSRCPTAVSEAPGEKAGVCPGLPAAYRFEGQ